MPTVDQFSVPIDILNSTIPLRPSANEKVTLRAHPAGLGEVNNIPDGLFMVSAILAALASAAL